MKPDFIRNIAIIAHVDHGKTTLVDQLLKQSGTLVARGEVQTCIMDSNEIERERGITILAKNTAISWGDYRINIVDTPGHADFGGEVERILSMVDSVLLVVDAVEGPMPQTRFVTQKAFHWGLKPIVVINKIDRPGAKPDQAINAVFDLFVSLGASDEQLDFPIVYASGLAGYAMLDLQDTPKDMHPLMNTIVERVSPPKVNLEGPVQMQITTLDYSSYVGAIGIGRVTRGQLKPNTPVVVIGADGLARNGRIAQVFTFLGLDKIETKCAAAGDIIAVTGIDPLHISDTLCDPLAVEPLPPLTVDEPTIRMMFRINDSPFVGRDGKYVTSRKLAERLERELITNVALKVEPLASGDRFNVSGRGELHLSILLENMRREGYEMAVSRPEVIQKVIDGHLCEPFEQLLLDIDEENQGSVMEFVAERAGQLKDMQMDGHGRVRLEYIIPTRGLIGFHGRFITMTSGSGISHHVFDHYAQVKDVRMIHRHNGVLISIGSGKTTAYALWNLQARGQMLIDPQTEVYEGMIIGIHKRENDLVVNVTRAKQLTNIRAAGSDENIILTPPVKLSLEEALAFINDDELVEITPSSIRLRKKLRLETDRRRSERQKE